MFVATAFNCGYGTARPMCLRPSVLYIELKYKHFNNITTDTFSYQLDLVILSYVCSKYNFLFCLNYRFSPNKSITF